MNTYIFIANIEKGPEGYRTEVIRQKTLGSALVELKKGKDPLGWDEINEVIEVAPDGLVSQHRNMQEAPQTTTHNPHSHE